MKKTNKEITILIIILAALLSVFSIFTFRDHFLLKYEQEQFNKIQKLNDDLLNNYDIPIELTVIKTDSMITTYKVRIESSLPTNDYFIYIYKGSESNYKTEKAINELTTAGDLYENIHIVDLVRVFNKEIQPSVSDYGDDYTEIMIKDLIGEEPEIIKVSNNNFFMLKKLSVIVRNKEGELKLIEETSYNKKEINNLTDEFKIKDLLTKEHMLKLNDIKIKNIDK